MIYTVDNPLILPRIMQIATRIKDLPAHDVLRDRLLKAIISPNSTVLIDRLGEQIRGLIYASRENLDGKDVCFIHLCYIDPKANIGHELLNRIRTWARKNDLDEIYMMTTRSSKGFERKYNFKFAYTVLKRRA